MAAGFSVWDLYVVMLKNLRNEIKGIVLVGNFWLNLLCWFHV